MDMASCLDYALHYLHRYPKTGKEMIMQLRKKWYEEDEINASMSVLMQKKYINDAQFAELYFNSEVIKKWKPLMTVTAKLLNKGIDRQTIKDVTSQLQTDIDAWMILKIQKEIQKLKAKEIEPMFIIQKLQQRWYSFSLIKRAINDSV